MKLYPEQLTILFNLYLQKHVIPGSSNHLPIFNTRAGGLALTKRLLMFLRDPKYSYLVVQDRVDVLELYRHIENYMVKNPKIFIIGLNHWFTKTDLKVLHDLYESYFIN